MGVPLLDLKAQYRTIREEIEHEIAEVLESQYFILGPKVVELEGQIAKYCHANHAVGVSSGTDALIIALMSEGLGAGDEVVTAPFTFFATAGSIHRVGARPVFVDIDPVTFNIDPSGIEAAITGKTRVIIPIHLFGQMADMDPILELAGARNLAVIEDAAQAIGSEDKGRRAGSLGAYGCFSFFPSKNLGGAGDGGIVTTQDDARHEKLVKMRVHGGVQMYHHEFVGGNFRIDALQAAVVKVKLKYLDSWTEGRRKNAMIYDRLLTDAGLLEKGVVLPRVVGSRHIFNQYTLRVPNRDGLVSHMKEKGVGCSVYYPVPMHLQECFGYLGYKEGDFPESEKAAREVISLPIYPELTEAQLEEVVVTVTEFYA
ncbi:MAG: DegT/DnrJ/EryC1/StrS family aminotransferase [bacterium]